MRPVTHMDPLCGTRYRSVGDVGKGGMGEVVVAEHLGLGKLVAVKLLHERLAHDPGIVKRMQIEARSLAALASPHIVQVTDFGQTATGRTYIVMERLVGRSLGDELRERKVLPVGEAIGYVLQVLAGLGAAHAMGIVHRDIKPDNIFLCDETKDTPRMVKILDFGIAKVLEVAAEAMRPVLPHLVTEAGTVIGTPRMLAPEQALGATVDARTDVYATGLLLYALLTGRGPFAHITDELDVIKACVEERPGPPSTRAPNYIPPALDAAVQRALEKRPADRFQSAEAFASELRGIAGDLAHSGPVAELTTGPLPSRVAEPVDALAANPRRTDPTLRLTGGPMTGAGSSTEPVPVSADASAAAPGFRRSSSTFVALTLLGAAVTALLLLVLSRVTP